MGVYIPNMDKPKRCLECWSGLAIAINCEAGTGFHNPDGELIPPDCPLIDIVQCKDCKWWDNNDDANRCTHKCGGMWAKPNAFCSYGERREK